MDLLKQLEAGFDTDRKLAEEIHKYQIERKSNDKEMIVACINAGAFEFISLNAGRIMSEIRRSRRIE